MLNRGLSKPRLQSDIFGYNWESHSKMSEWMMTIFAPVVYLVTLLHYNLPPPAQNNRPFAVYPPW